MPDRLSLMLDSMIFAVDHGLSFDGIVSIPEIGLEDFGQRPGMAGWFDDSEELFRTTTAAFSRFFHRTSPTPIETPPRDDTRSASDSGMGSSANRHSRRDHVTSPDSPASQTSHISEEDSQEEGKEGKAQLGPGSDQQVPGNTENEETRPWEKFPRKRGEQADGANEETRSSAQEILPGKRDEWVPDIGQKLPSQESAQVMGDIAHPSVGQSLSTSLGNEEDANRPSNVPERNPRLKDKERTRG